MPSFHTCLVLACLSLLSTNVAFYTCQLPQSTLLALLHLPNLYPPKLSLYFLFSVTGSYSSSPTLSLPGLSLSSCLFLEYPCLLQARVSDSTCLLPECLPLIEQIYPRPCLWSECPALECPTMYFFLSIPVFCWKGKTSSSYNVPKKPVPCEFDQEPKTGQCPQRKTWIIIVFTANDRWWRHFVFFLGLLNIFVFKYSCQIYVAYGTGFCEHLKAKFWLQRPLKKIRSNCVRPGGICRFVPDVWTFKNTCLWL
jgi:hypothetical protein